MTGPTEVPQAGHGHGPATLDPGVAPAEADARRLRPERHMLESLVCPITQGRLEWDREKQELISRAARLAFPLRDGIPIMIASEARPLDP